MKEIDGGADVLEKKREGHEERAGQNDGEAYKSVCVRERGRETD